MIRIEGAIIGVGHLILQRVPKAAQVADAGSLILQGAPKALMVPESVLEGNYDAALEEFKADVRTHLKHDFEPPHGFRTAVLSHLRWYLEQKGVLQ